MESIQTPIPPNKPLLIMALAGLALSAAVWVLAYWLKPVPKPLPVVTKAPLVNTLRLEQNTGYLPLHSQGIVKPRLETPLLAEVSGRILSISEDFESGAFVKAGQWLLSIEDTDYVADVRAAEAEYARAVAEYEQTVEEARQAEKDWKLLGRIGQANDLALKKPQLAQAQASVASAQAGLTRARNALERTRIKAPYAGLIASRPVQLGQYVNQGVELGQIYGTEVADVRLSVTFAEYQLIDPVDITVQLSSDAVPGVSWQGYLHRLEHRIDPDNRMVYLTVRVKDPYALGDALSTIDGPLAVPMPFGLYVNAVIEIPAPEPLLAIPRTLLTSDERVWVVTEQQQLALRTPEILYKDRQQAYVRAGLRLGERLLLSGVSTPLPGLPVRLASKQGTTSSAQALQGVR